MGAENQITLEEAKRSRRCRICGESITFPGGAPLGFQEEFGEQVFPQAVTFNFGKEFAHTLCLSIEGSNG